MLVGELESVPRTTAHLIFNINYEFSDMGGKIASKVVID